MEDGKESSNSTSGSLLTFGLNQEGALEDEWHTLS